MTEDEKLIAELRRDEGVVDHAYQDSLGYWTIGIGRLIDKRKGGKLSNDEIDYLLANDIDRFVKELDALYPWWRKLNPVRQRVIINMTFNMGVGWLKSFKNTTAAIKAGDYKKAAAGMRASLWAKQVGARAERLAKMMETGNELT
jgi:lysozyme